MQSREEFINEACALAYRNEPYELMGAVYDLGRTLPEDHSFQKLIEWSWPYSARRPLLSETD
jgi:hypothetical protein